jgi:hypothetical protein
MIATSATIPSSTRLRVLALSRHLYHLGPRPLFEWACEIVGGSSDPLGRLEAYGRLDPDIVRALGGDRLPATVRRIK